MSDRADAQEYLKICEDALKETDDAILAAVMQESKTDYDTMAAAMLESKTYYDTMAAVTRESLVPVAAGVQTPAELRAAAAMARLANKDKNTTNGIKKAAQKK
jgi:6,7-dimethyl-8-ribityllumazine synthase